MANKQKTDSNVSPLIEKNCFQREDEKKATLNSSVELRAPFEALAVNAAALQARVQFQEKLRLRDEHEKAQLTSSEFKNDQERIASG